jgi:hypothetical protein
MSGFGRLLAPVAIVAGMASAAVFADDSPLAPRSLEVRSASAESGISYDGVTFSGGNAVCDGLTLICPTYVRGPATIVVHAGTVVYVPAGSVVLVSWEPAVRGYRFLAVTGEVIVCFENTVVRLCPCDAITLLTDGNLWGGPGSLGFFRPSGLEGLPEVSGFRPFEDD